MITYREILNSNNDIKEVRVFSDGRRAGTIEYVRKPLKGWRYVPKGRRKLAGPVLQTVFAVKKTLEGE